MVSHNTCISHVSYKEYINNSTILFIPNPQSGVWWRINCTKSDQHRLVRFFNESTRYTTTSIIYGKGTLYDTRHTLENRRFILPYKYGEMNNNRSMVSFSTFSSFSLRSVFVWLWESRKDRWFRTHVETGSPSQITSYLKTTLWILDWP